MNVEENLNISMTAAEGNESQDVPAKRFFARKEILSNILKYTVSEYKDESLEKIMDYIEGDTIQTGTALVSEDAAQTIRGERTETWTMEEASAEFDVVFRSLLPVAEGAVAVNLHIDLEIQNDFSTIYPIVKRGIYYAVRQLSAQLPKIGKNGIGYKNLEKVYSIWICVNKIPEKLKNTVSFYKIQNYRNDVSDNETDLKEDKDCDLLEVVIIRLGADGAAQRGLLDMLYGLFSGERKKVFSYLPQAVSVEDVKEDDEMLDMVTIARTMGEELGERRGEKRGEERGEKRGISLCAAIIAVLKREPTAENAAIAGEIGYSEEEVAEVRKSLGV